MTNRDKLLQKPNEELAYYIDFNGLCAFCEKETDIKCGSSKSCYEARVKWLESEAKDD